MTNGLVVESFRRRCPFVGTEGLGHVRGMCCRTLCRGVWQLCAPAEAVRDNIGPASAASCLSHFKHGLVRHCRLTTISPGPRQFTQRWGCKCKWAGHRLLSIALSCRELQLRFCLCSLAEKLRYLEKEWNHNLHIPWFENTDGVGMALIPLPQAQASASATTV